MKQFFIGLILSLIVYSNISAQDSLYIYSNDNIIWREAVEQVDSIILKNFDASPELQYFGFTRAHNNFLQQDIVCKIENDNISSNIYLHDKNLIAEFYTHPDNTVEINGVEQVSGVTKNNFAEEITYTVTNKIGISKEYTTSIKWVNGLPEISITTVNNEPVTEKREYVRGRIDINGKGFYYNTSDSMNIRGRGNSTWGMPKKPYRFKLDSKASVCGLKPAKNWILLAEYLDPSFLKNAVAFKTAQLLGLPFTHTAVPTVVTFNDRFVGVYILTEHKEVKENRIEIDKTEGVLYELDTYFDEDYQFYSSGYNLPVMLQSPKLEELEEPERTEKFNLFKSYFEELEQVLLDENFPANNYKDLIDIQSLVDYIIVYDLTLNREINFPKSTYMYKDKGEKFHMGPIWDFDWGFGYNYPDQHFENHDVDLFSTTPDALGAVFFKRFFNDPEFKTMYKSRWEEFRSNNHLKSILNYIDDNAENIAEYQAIDNELWKNGVNDYMAFISEMKLWIENRANYMDDKVKDW